MNTTMNKLHLKSFALIAMAFLFCFAFAFQALSAQKLTAHAEFENISVTNANFSSASGHSLTSPSGWTSLGTIPSYARAGVVDVTSAAFATYGNTTSENSSYYMLDEQPTKFNGSFDDKILMLNARSNSYSFGYKSSNISLTANSYYIVSVYARANENATFSIYLSNVTEEENDSRAMFVSSSQGWNKYNFFVATNNTPKTINLELWLGSRTGATSKNAVFFDNVFVQKTSHNLFSLNYNDTFAAENNKLIDLDATNAYYTPAGLTNLNFETTVNNPFPLTEDSVTAEGYYVQIRALNEQIENNAFGTNLRANNNKGLVIHTPTEAAIGVQTPEFDLPRGSIVKITVSMKVSSKMTGNAYIKLVETGTEELKAAFPDYTLNQTKSNQISSNQTSITTNNYTAVSFVIKANTLLDSKARLEFWLGDKTAKAVGTVVFDDVTFQTISHADYESSMSNTTKVSLNTIANNPSIENGTLNVFENQTNQIVYPVQPSAFTRTYEESILGADEKLIYGVINTNQAHFDAQGYVGFTNPGGLQGQNTNFATESNNVLLVQNKVVSYQEISTKTFTLNANTVYDITFQVRAAAFAHARVENANGTVLASAQNIMTSQFTLYRFTIRTNSTNQTVKIVFGVGTKENPTNGFAFFDNFASQTVTYTDEAFAALQPNHLHHVVDLKNGLFLKGNVSTNELNLYQPSFLKGTLTSGVSLGSEIAYGGIIDGNHPLFALPNHETNTNQNVLLIKNNGTATYQFATTLNESLAANTYHRVSIWVKTVLTNPNNLIEDLGATLSGTSESEKFANLLTNGEYQEFVFLYHGATAKTLTFTFGLASPNNDVNGYALFTQPKMETLTKETFTTEANQLKLEVPSTNIIDLSIPVQEEEEEPVDELPLGNQFDFLLLPSLITALALIIAMVGFGSRRIKFKRIQFKQKSSYDRENTLSSNVIRIEAEALKKEETARHAEKIAATSALLQELEESYAESLKTYREEKANLSKEEKAVADKAQEKLFKTYSSKRAKLENQLETLNEKSKEMESVEYLLMLERRVIRNNKKQAKLAKQEIAEAANKESK